MMLAVLQDVDSAHLVLGGVLEWFIGTWLILERFSPSATVFSAPTNTTSASMSPQPQRRAR
jgi:hypothetical protein